MKTLTITAALGLVLSLLYLACRAESRSAPPTGPAATEAVTPPARPAPQEKKGAEKPAPQPASPSRKEKEEKTGPGVKERHQEENTGAPSGGFDPNAFPPTVSDTEYHQDAWYRDDCLRCHETGVENAPRVRHKGMAPVLLQAKCRSCHVLIRGSAPGKRGKTPEEEEGYMKGAFPPMIPDSASHRNAWTDESCLLCHETGNRGAPLVKHENLPKVLLKAKCRSCHVQVRSSKVKAPVPGPAR